MEGGRAKYAMSKLILALSIAIFFLPVCLLAQTGISVELGGNRLCVGDCQPQQTDDRFDVRSGDDDRTFLKLPTKTPIPVSRIGDDDEDDDDETDGGFDDTAGFNWDSKGE